MYNAAMIISFLASHGGSSARAIIEAIRAGELDADIGILITNNRDSAIFHWCLDNDVPVRHISSKTHRGEEQADEAIETVLRDMDTDLVVCSGYMKKVGPHTLAAFPGRILNIHPALLPAHGGRGLYGDRVHAAVLDDGDSESGATVHVVTEDYDEGPVIAQARVPVNSDDSVATLRRRVQQEEPGLYIRALRQFLQEVAE